MRGAIRFYQLFISPLTPGYCRYWPSCSAYGMTAIARHGALKGGWLTLRRILRCHPWGAWGFDPVPGKARHVNCGHSAPPAARAAAPGQESGR
ncbi:MAG: membrane protein insertion efficiency factor YidD [Alphaproteobacteria bacterium]|nr:membrane protein insertion efficiency factor YidD [Alphaproteobacteria bacterium]